MSTRWPLIISSALIALMALAGLWAWTQLPAGASIVVHWDASGMANGYADKTRGLFMLPAIAAGICLLMAVIPLIEPRRLNLAASGIFYRTVWIGVVLVLAVAQAAVVLTALRVPFGMQSVTMVAVSLLLAVMGNYLGKTRSNFFAGVRTPWTLSSDYSWEKTHRLAGRLFVVLGVLNLGTLAIAGSKLAVFVLVPGLIAIVSIAVVMSYVYWKRDPDKDNRGAITE